MKRINFIKGIIIGIAKVIPGLSGALIMVSFNLYDKAIDAITNFFSDAKENFYFLLELALGIVIGIIFFSKVIFFFLKIYPLYTTAFFIGLIIGGIPKIINDLKIKPSNYLLTLMFFLLFISLTITKINTVYIIHNNYIDYLFFFLAGLCEAIGTILPGVSSTVLLMLIGAYPYYIKTMSNLLSPLNITNNLLFIIPFSLGMIIGIIIISIIVNHLLKKHKNKLYASILGFSIASIFLLIIKIIPYFQNIFSIMLSIFLLTIGYFITNKL